MPGIQNEETQIGEDLEFGALAVGLAPGLRGSVGPRFFVERRFA